MGAKIFALMNQKGGVGKTTTTANLARAAVVAGRRTLVVDNDPQGSLTTCLAGETVEPGQVGLADALSARTDETLRDVIVETRWKGLDLVPTPSQALSVVRDELVVASFGREGRLRDALEEVGEDYDLVLIDCAPAVDLLVTNAMVAAHGVVVVTEAEVLSTNGLVDLLTTISEVRRHYNASLTLAGIIVNHFEAHTKEAQNGLAELTEAATAQGWPLLAPPIPKRAFLKAVKNGVGLDEIRGSGASDAAYFASVYTTMLTAIEGAL